MTTVTLRWAGLALGGVVTGHIVPSIAGHRATGRDEWLEWQ